MFTVAASPRSDAPRLLSLLAVLALLQPLLVPFAPTLGGWSPLHSHIYRDGVPITHTHPWEQGRPPSTPKLICNLHGAPHELPAPGPAARDSAAERESGGDTVGFTQDGPGVAAVALAPTAPMPVCPDAITTATSADEPTPLPIAYSPAPPPPRA